MEQISGRPSVEVSCSARIREPWPWVSVSCVDPSACEVWRIDRLGNGNSPHPPPRSTATALQCRTAPVHAADAPHP